VVRIEQVFIQFPLGSFERSQIPANANNSPLIDFKTVRRFGFSRSHPLVKLSAGIRHLRDFNASRNASLVAAVSDRALIMLPAADESFDHAGMSPRASERVRGQVSLGFGG
jgi:hypothetical protein